MNVVARKTSLIDLAKSDGDGPSHSVSPRTAPSQTVLTLPVSLSLDALNVTGLHTLATSSVSHSDSNVFSEFQKMLQQQSTLIRNSNDSRTSWLRQSIQNHRRQCPVHRIVQYRTMLVIIFPLLGRLTSGHVPVSPRPGLGPSRSKWKNFSLLGRLTSGHVQVNPRPRLGPSSSK